MVLNAPLSVRMSDGSTDRHVTKYASGLSFTKAAPGGHMSCQFRVNLPRNTFNDLGPQDKCWIYSNTGRTIFGAGYLENPTPLDGLGGQAFDIQAFGGMALASDESRALIYADRTLGFETAANSSPSATTDAGDWIVDPAYQRVRVAFPGGNLASSGALASAENSLFGRAGMNLGAIRVGDAVSGKSDANYAQEFVTTSGTYATGAMSNVGGTMLLFVDDDFPAGDRVFAFRLRRSSGLGTNVADDTTWTDWVDYSVVGQRMDRNGVLLIGAAGLGSAASVLASQVAEDLLGRVLTMCDPATAVIDATTFAINQLAYPDGAKAASILTDLEQWEPDHWWGIGASGNNGLHDFWYRQYATEPRYVVSVKDGWRQTGSDVDLCNQITVYYTDATGAQQHETITAAGLGLVGYGLPVDALGSRTKEAEPITLPAGKGSAANALQIGAAVLRDKITPPLAGTITVRRPIVDRLTGNRVEPWELEPGSPVLVQEPGHSLRCSEMTYDDPSVASTLALGRPVLTESQRVAKLARVA